MKRNFIFFFIFCLGFFACSKPEVKTEPKPKIETEPTMEFTINGASDATYKFEQLVIPLTIELVSGPQEKVDLSISGLPTGVKSTFSSPSGTPTFTSALEFTLNGTVNLGTYPLKINATTASGKVKTVGMNFTIANDCGHSLVGNYKGFIYEDGVLTGTISSCIITIKTDNPNRLYMNLGIGDTKIIDLNCANQTLTIPPESGFTYSGIFKTPDYLEITEVSATDTVIIKFERN